MNKRFLHILFTLIITAGMTFSIAGTSVNAAQTSSLNNVKIQSTSLKQQVKNPKNKKSISDDIASSKMRESDRRNSTLVKSITVYPATDVYDKSINDTQYYAVTSSTRSYTFTQSVKDKLIAQYKARFNKAPTGWYVKITFLITTERNDPAYLYLKFNGQKLKDYPIILDDGDSETISYYTNKDNSYLGGYIDYGQGYTEIVGSGTNPIIN